MSSPRKDQLLHRKRAALEDSQQFRADRSRRADESDVVGFLRVGHSASYRRFQ
jgi:hypothetical protein